MLDDESGPEPRRGRRRSVEVIDRPDDEIRPSTRGLSPEDLAAGIVFSPDPGHTSRPEPPDDAPSPDEPAGRHDADRPGTVRLDPRTMPGAPGATRHPVPDRRDPRRGGRGGRRAAEAYGPDDVRPAGRRSAAPEDSPSRHGGRRRAGDDELGGFAAGSHARGRHGADAPAAGGRYPSFVDEVRQTGRYGPEADFGIDPRDPLGARSRRDVPWGDRRYPAHDGPGHRSAGYDLEDPDDTGYVADDDDLTRYRKPAAGTDPRHRDLVTDLDRAFRRGERQHRRPAPWEAWDRVDGPDVTGDAGHGPVGRRRGPSGGRYRPADPGCRPADPGYGPVDPGYDLDEAGYDLDDAGHGRNGATPRGLVDDAEPQHEDLPGARRSDEDADDRPARPSRRRRTPSGAADVEPEHGRSPSAGRSDDDTGDRPARPSRRRRGRPGDADAEPESGRAPGAGRPDDSADDRPTGESRGRRASSERDGASPARRRRWPWVVGAVAAVAAAVPIGLFVLGGPGDEPGAPQAGTTVAFGTSNADPAPPAAEGDRAGAAPALPADTEDGAAPAAAAQVTYEVKGSGEAGTITFGGGSSVAQVSDAELPWKRTSSAASEPTEYTVTAAGGAGPISCRILVGDTVISEETSKGDYAAVSCSGRH